MDITITVGSGGVADEGGGGCVDGGVCARDSELEKDDVAADLGDDHRDDTPGGD